MSELRKANTSHAYFVTLSVVGWIDIFTRERYCQIIEDSLQFCTQHKALEVYGWVIMPSHLHLIVRNNDGLLPAILRDMKSFTAKKILESIDKETGESRKNWLLYLFKYFAKHRQQNSTYMFWQKSSYPVVLDRPEIFDQKLEYIHDNPVKAGYVLRPEAWRYSSASPVNKVKVLRG